MSSCYILVRVGTGRGVNRVIGSGLSGFEKIKINPQPDPIRNRVYRVVGCRVGSIGLSGHLLISYHNLLFFVNITPNENYLKLNQHTRCIYFEFIYKKNTCNNKVPVYKKWAYFSKFLTVACFIAKGDAFVCFAHFSFLFFKRVGLSFNVLLLKL